eukprot:2891704-Rhodomonas_salina.1
MSGIVLFYALSGIVLCVSGTDLGRACWYQLGGGGDTVEVKVERVGPLPAGTASPLLSYAACDFVLCPLSISSLLLSLALPLPLLISPLLAFPFLSFSSLARSPPSFPSPSPSTDVACAAAATGLPVQVRRGSEWAGGRVVKFARGRYLVKFAPLGAAAEEVEGWMESNSTAFRCEIKDE